MTCEQCPTLQSGETWRRCERIGCRYHLLIDRQRVAWHTGAESPTLETLPVHCALDIAGLRTRSGAQAQRRREAAARQAARQAEEEQRVRALERSREATRRAQRAAIRINMPASGRALALLLAERQMSRASFARALGVGRTTVGYWCNGLTAPTPKVRRRIAEMLSMDPWVGRYRRPFLASRGAPIGA
jgi:DNA-binding transcriptional regulator YiaG